jgi:hypothetical protein
MATAVRSPCGILVPVQGKVSFQEDPYSDEGNEWVSSEKTKSVPRLNVPEPYWILVAKARMRFFPSLASIKELI